jgi:hypothetical protein
VTPGATTERRSSTTWRTRARSTASISAAIAPPPSGGARRRLSSGALEAGSDTQPIVAEKVTLRDITEDERIDAAQTIDELKAIAIDG